MPESLSAQSAWSVVGLALVCTALAFVVFFALIDEIGPSRATVFTYVNPAVALLLGVPLLDEPFTLGIAVGFPLILAGSVLATRRTGEPAVAGVAEATIATTVADKWLADPAASVDQREPLAGESEVRPESVAGDGDGAVERDPLDPGQRLGA